MISHLYKEVKIMWYEDEALINLSIRHKDAMDNKIVTKIEEISLDKVYWQGRSNSTIVNYSNLLSTLARIPSAIQKIIKVAVTGFSMAVGNLDGYLKHYVQLDYNTGHKNFFLYEMRLLLKFVTENKDSSLYPQASERFQKELDDGLNFFEGVTIQSLDLNDILLFREEISKLESIKQFNL